MRARFYAPDAEASGLVALPADEAEHARRVLRLGRGDAIVVFNGRGKAFEAEIESVTRDAVRVRVGLPVASAPEARTAITLVQAVLKGDHMDDVVRDAVMIGVGAIQPILTARTEVSRATLERGRRRDRWERVAVSSVKQCGRAVVPPVLPPEPFESLVAQWRAQTPGGPVVMFVEPGASGRSLSLAAAGGDVVPASPSIAHVVIGPEGGWNAEEVAAAETACQLVTLGGRTIRADAMPLVAITALLVRWGEFQ